MASTSNSKRTPYKKQEHMAVGPYKSADMPDYQSAVQHYNAQWAAALSNVQQEIIQFVMASTVRFNRRTSCLKADTFFTGIEPNTDTNFAGVAPIRHMAKQVFHNGCRELVRLGIMTRRGQRYGLNYSTTLVHLISDDSVVRRILHQNSHGGELSTKAGIAGYAARALDWYLRPLHPKVTHAADSHEDSYEGIPELLMPIEAPQDTAELKIPETLPEPAETIKAGIDLMPLLKPKKQRESVIAYSIAPTLTNQIFPYKYGNIGVGTPRRLPTLILSILQKSTTADAILAHISNEVAEKRGKVKERRKKRRNPVDCTALFEAGWLTGQRERSTSIPAFRLAARERRAFKDSVVQPLLASDNTTDFEELGRWTALHWNEIGHQYFKKSTSYPINPAAMWFVACSQTYLQVFQTRDALTNFTTLDDKELYRRAEAYDDLRKELETVNARHTQELAEVSKKRYSAERRADRVERFADDGKEAALRRARVFMRGLHKKHRKIDPKVTLADINLLMIERRKPLYPTYLLLSDIANYKDEDDY